MAEGTPQAATTTYTYDEARSGFYNVGFLKAIPGIITSTAYNARGQATTLSRANGVVTTYGWSAQRGWLTAGSDTYAYDGENRLTWWGPSPAARSSPTGRTARGSRRSSAADQTRVGLSPGLVGSASAGFMGVVWSSCMKYIAIKGELPEACLDVASYRAYLKTVKDRFPSGAFEYAAAPWHYDYTDPRSIHDGRLESVEILDRREFGKRYLDIRVRVSGAYRVELSYSRVRRYNLSFDVDPDPEFPRGHGQWVLDEVTLTDDNHVLHEIEFERGTWRIECEDMRYSFTLKEAVPPESRS